MSPRGAEVRSALVAALCLLSALCGLASAGAVPNVLSGAPAYDWYHGCGPTAAGSIIGYWDQHGFDGLFTMTGRDVVSLTANVGDQISSPAHNAKYDPDPDDPDLPTPRMTSIADFFRTSVNQTYGWSYLSYSDDALAGYAQSRGYEAASWYEGYGTNLWDHLVQSIDAGRPVMFLIDTFGDGLTDHFVPVFGYDDRGESGKYYACYTTWSEDETIVWKEFRPMGNAWGVGYATFMTITPEPTALTLLAMGGALLFRRSKRSLP